mgnify:CR=1 FL=1
MIRANLKPMSQETAIKRSDGGDLYDSADQSHTNYAYDFTTNNPIHYQQKQLLKMNESTTAATNKITPVIKQQSSTSTEEASTSGSNMRELRSRVEDLLSRNFLSAAANNRAAAPYQQQANARHLPQSIEKPMIQNFKSMNLKVTVNSETDDENVKLNAKQLMLDSLTMSMADQSLRDEDAWLPILNIAEEQVKLSIS